MRRLWLIFAQAVTVSVAVLFVLNTLKPEWLRQATPAAVVAILEAPAGAEQAPAVGSYAPAAQRSMPGASPATTSSTATQSPAPRQWPSHTTRSARFTWASA